MKIMLNTFSRSL